MNAWIARSTLLVASLSLTCGLHGCRKVYERKKHTTTRPFRPASLPSQDHVEFKVVGTERKTKPSFEELKLTIGRNMQELEVYAYIYISMSAPPGPAELAEIANGRFTGSGRVEGADGIWYLLQFQDGTLVDVEVLPQSRADPDNANLDP